jgi:hypothetical protein
LKLDLPLNVATAEGTDNEAPQALDDFAYRNLGVRVDGGRHLIDRRCRLAGSFVVRCGAGKIRPVKVSAALTGPAFGLQGQITHIS